MSITLTCPCGQQQAVAPAMAGRAVACVTCGRTLNVPAMGVLAKTAATKPPRRTAPVWPVMVAVGSLLTLLLLGSGAWLAWALSQRPSPPEPILAEQPKPEAPPEQPTPKPVETLPDSAPPTSDDRNGSTPKKSTPILTRPQPKQVLEPVQPNDAAKKVDEPVKPKDDAPPKKIIEPVKPKEQPKQSTAPLIEPVKLVWKLREGETFLQEVGVTQRPTFKVQGLPIEMHVQYIVVSRFTVTKQHKDGSLVVEQKIEDARLVRADDLSRPSIVAGLLQLKGATYTLELSPKMDVTRFDGVKDNPQIKNVPVAGGFGVHAVSLIDADGWKELAQATFFQLDETPKPQQRWSKPMTHQWGVMGSWQGKIHYLYVGYEKNLHRVNYGLELVYKTPPAGVGAGMLKVNAANFQPQQAGGSLLFDTARGRVTYAEELFHVKGVLNANVLGQNTLVEIDERQHFVIRIHDKLP